MDIVASYASRIIAECAWCKNPIEKESRIFRGYYKNKHRVSWTTKIYWHFDCYPEQAKSYLTQHPYEVKTRGTTGRPSLGLSKEHNAKRVSLLGRASQLRKDMLDAQRMVTPIMKKLSMEKAQQYYNKVRNDLTKLGGIPDSWRKKGW